MHLVATLDIGGAERHLVELVKRLNRKKYNSLVCCLTRGGPLEKELTRAGIKYLVIGKKFKLDFSVIPKLVRLIKLNRVDILHTYMFTSNSFGRAAGILSGVKGMIISEQCVDIWKTRLHFLIDRVLLRRTDRVICISEGVKKFYTSKLGIKKEKATTIYNCIAPVDSGQHAENDIVRKYDLKPHERVIGSAGRLAEQKGVKYLLIALPSIIRKFPETKLLVVGDGPEREKLYKLREKLALNGKVIFAGLQGNVGAFLSAMEIFVLPSLFEGLGMVCLEAMALAKPVVATRIPTLDEVVKDGETGILVPPKNPEALAGAILRLLDNREKAKRMGIAGRKRVEKHFNTDSTVKQHEAVYDHLAEKLNLNP